jgi:hypothetical protein
LLGHVARRQDAGDYGQQHAAAGRVTMRRLNRMEYEFTVNDLFGLDVTVMEDLSSLSQKAHVCVVDIRLLRLLYSHQFVCHFVTRRSARRN